MNKDAQTRFLHPVWKHERVFKVFSWMVLQWLHFFRIFFTPVCSVFSRVKERWCEIMSDEQGMRKREGDVKER